MNASKDQQPFTDYVTKRGRNNTNWAWITAGIMGALLIVISLFWATDVGHLRGVEARLQEATNKLKEALAENQKNSEQIAALQEQVNGLQKEKEKVGQSAKSLEDEMRADLESKDVTISNLKGKLTVNILDRVMFDSGEATLKRDGETVLAKIANILDGHPELKIQVIGHTDNVPIRNRFTSNWELSTARALAAVHFLTEKAGVNPRNVGAAGYGEYRPIADNSTPEGRAKNRRIAITILPDELAVADAVPAESPKVPTDIKPATTEQK